MVRTTHGAGCSVSLATWRAVHSVAMSCQVIASAICALVRSAAWRCTIAQLCICLSACFAGPDDAVCPHILQAPR
jgi:hypothetical protein